MLLVFVLQFFVNIVNFLTSWIPHVDTLPFGIDEALTLSIGYFNAFLLVFWPMQIVWTMFLWYVFAVLPGLYVLKLFLGHRLPAHV